MVGKEKSDNTFKKFIVVYVAIFFILISFVLGFLVGSQTGADGKSSSIQQVINDFPASLTKKDFDPDLFWQIWSSVEERYVEQPVDPQNLFYGALSGMVNSLSDPYSIFLNPELTGTFKNEISGSFEGIGAEIGIKNEKLVIIAPLPNSPAEKSGLKSGDHISKIEDLETSGMTLDYAVSLIRGQKGSTVTLTVKRENEEAKEIEINRDVIKVSSVDWEMKSNNIVYLKISQFTEDTIPELDKAINSFLIKEPKGLILDLRNNPGGFLEVAVEVLEKFFEDKIAVIEEGSTGDRNEYKTDKNKAQLKNLKMVVLVNGGSASASEIVAGALQDYELAAIVGEKTFGKGSVQDLEEFKDGSSLKLTIARWLTPLGHSIDGQGIIPDIEIELTEEDYNNDLDPQIDEAIELLEK